MLGLGVWNFDFPVWDPRNQFACIDGATPPTVCYVLRESIPFCVWCEQVGAFLVLALDLQNIQYYCIVYGRKQHTVYTVYIYIYKSIVYIVYSTGLPGVPSAKASTTSRRRKVVVPKGSFHPIKQTMVNLFSSGNWKGLSDSEANTRPKPVTVIPVPVPFFDQPAERASWTLRDAFSKDLLGSSIVVFVDCRYCGCFSFSGSKFYVSFRGVLRHGSLNQNMKVLSTPLIWVFRIFVETMPCCCSISQGTMDGMSGWFRGVRLID